MTARDRVVVRVVACRDVSWLMRGRWGIPALGCVTLRIASDVAGGARVLLASRMSQTSQTPQTSQTSRRFALFV
jgi:hypothetical protein